MVGQSSSANFFVHCSIREELWKCQNTISGLIFLPEIKEQTFLFPGEEQVEEIGRCVCATAVTAVTSVTIVMTVMAVTVVTAASV